MGLTDLIISYPKISIIAISLAVTVLMTIVTKFLTDQEKMKELKEKQKACQKLMKDFKDNPAKMMEIQKDMMACSAEIMKNSFKPLMITMIPLLLLIIWLRKIYTLTSIASNWIWWYIISGFIFSMVFKKVLKVQ